MKYFVIFLLLIVFASILLIPQALGIPFFTEEQKIAVGQFIAIAEITSYHDDGIYRFYDAKIIKWLKNPLEQEIVSFRSVNEKGFEPHAPKAIFEVGDYAVINLRDYDRGFLESTFFSKKISEDEIESEIKRIEALVKLNINPLKQFKFGVSIDEIQCRNDYVLIQKHDGTPACVKPETKQKLIERGWTRSITEVNPNSIPEITKNQVVDIVRSDMIKRIEDPERIDFYVDSPPQLHLSLFYIGSEGTPFRVSSFDYSIAECETLGVLVCGALNPSVIDSIRGKLVYDIGVTYHNDDGSLTDFYYVVDAKNGQIIHDGRNLR